MTEPSATGGKFDAAQITSIERWYEARLHHRDPDVQSGRVACSMCEFCAFSDPRLVRGAGLRQCIGRRNAQVLAEFSDPRLVIIRQPRNIGPIANWNACVEHARGEFIVMLSDDDYLAPHFLTRCDDVRPDRTEAVRVIVALGDVVDPGTGWMNPARQSQALGTGIRRGTDVLSEFLLGAISPQMCTVAIRTESLRDAGGFPQGWHHAGDLVVWVPLLLDGDVGFVNEACGTQSTHADTQTAGMSLETRLEEIDRLGRVLVDAAVVIDDRATAVDDREADASIRGTESHRTHRI